MSFGFIFGSDGPELLSKHFAVLKVTAGWSEFLRDWEGELFVAVFSLFDVFDDSEPDLRVFPELILATNVSDETFVVVPDAVTDE